MGRPNPHAKVRKGRLGRIKPSYLVLLALLPLLILLYTQDPDYQRALRFLLPGLNYTISVTVLGYALASVLGLALAGMMLVPLGRWTVPGFYAAAAVLAVGGGATLTFPTEELVLAGGTEGRVAILRGTPTRLVDVLKEGSYAEGAEGRSFVSALDAGAALGYLEEGRVGAVFLPGEEIPPELEERWRVTFLPDSARNPAMLALALGFLLALLAFAAQQSREHPLSVFAELYVDLIRGVPMLVVILFIGFVIPGAVRDLTGGRIVIQSDLLRGVLAIAIGYAAYMAEIFRAGIEAIPRGQVEAARSLGLDGMQTARFVVLPQAIRIVLPPLGNEFIAMLKDTALLSVIGVGDVTQKAREFGAATLNLFPPYNSAAVIYIALTLSASSLLHWLERRADVSKGG
ncbi:MAG: amino acid ABC transporter permease [Trueperaceae bacterium]|nr:amino acid ABC transporter permease [Trueperaceae bacterium]